MCGICVSLVFKKQHTSNTHNNVGNIYPVAAATSIKRRGPDHFKEVSHNYNNSVYINFISSVLHLRGDSPSLQPIEDENGHLFMWNGEIFGGLEVSDTLSDTSVLSLKLFSCSSKSEVLSVLSSLQGPFAFIFYDKKTGLLWYGRDIFGRRSLLWNANETSFHLCSIASQKDIWQEVTTEGIFCLDLNESCEKKSFSIHVYPWGKTSSGLCIAPSSNQSFKDFVLFKTMYDLHVDCPISIPLNRNLPTEEVLKNCFPPENQGQNPSDENLLSKLVELPSLKDYVYKFEAVLSKAVQNRVHNHSHLCKSCHTIQTSKKSCEHASVGVLFSGGLDSIVIACLIHRHLKENEPVDLINVAFASNANLKASGDKQKELLFDTPDRLTGKSGVKALRRICPSRSWNFIQVNVSEEDLISHRKETISHLLKPSCTVLDDSIGCALWFAAQGNGVVMKDDEYISYKSQSRILLLGMGADEQLGGYSRHRAKFSSTGWLGLIEELSMELDRIGSRNLGRDDRIIADHGVESRYPFLDESVVSFLNGLPVWIKMNLNYGRGIGEKLLLRLLALKLGLVEAAVLPKRAIQFGSRIAKIENSKEKGSDICERLKMLHQTKFHEKD